MGTLSTVKLTKGDGILVVEVPVSPLLMCAKWKTYFFSPTIYRTIASGIS